MTLLQARNPLVDKVIIIVFFISKPVGSLVLYDNLGKGIITDGQDGRRRGIGLRIRVIITANRIQFWMSLKTILSRSQEMCILSYFNGRNQIPYFNTRNYRIKISPSISFDIQKLVISVPLEVLIVRSNSIVNSPRITKIAGSLKKKYSIKVVGWNREGVPKERIISFVTDLELLNISAPFASLKIVLYLPIFWTYLLYKFILYRPEIVHACDLDTLPPSLIFKALFRKKLVFDVCDRYAMSKIPPRRRLLYRVVNWLEESLGRKADYMINVSKARESTFRHKPDKTAIIMNCADEDFIQRDHHYPLSNVDGLKLVYTGNIIRGRGLEQVNEAIRDIEKVQFIIAGKVIDDGLLKDLTMRSKNTYMGSLPLTEALSLEASADAMVILYDPNIPNNKYANPNKLFEAMMFGVPVITNVVGEIVHELSCGLFVEYSNIEQIKNAIISLINDEKLRGELGANGKSGFENKYNWPNMETRLFRLYGSLRA